MKKSILLTVLLAAVLGVTQSDAQENIRAEAISDSKFPLFSTEASAQSHCPFDFVVWLNIKSETYTFDRPVSTTKQEIGACAYSCMRNSDQESGAYICQRDADQMDYHFGQVNP